MKSIGIALLLLVPAALPAALPAETTVAALDFARYEVILGRKPFGEPPQQPPGPQPAIGVKPQPNFYDDLYLVAITEREGGTRVGFVNRKTNKDHFLYVGETADGITVVSADYDEGVAVLRNGEQEGEVRFRQGMSAGPATGAPPAAPPSKKASPFLQNRTSYLARLRERRAKIAQEQAAKRKENVLKGENLEQHLQKYQMEVIRKGMPPLPVPLTEAMDKQLVQEGVLPAREEN